jgi:WxL domain surface cell wall-binding
MSRLSRPLLICLSGALAVSLFSGSLTFAVPPAPAWATPCGTDIAAGAACADTGTLALSAGSLSLTSPDALSWSATLNGANQTVPDASPAHETFQVTDATGSGAGWHVAVSATQFVNGTSALPDTGTMTVTGSTGSVSAATAPTASCATGSTCTLPTDTTAYPVAIATAASSPSPVTVYDASADTGMGTVEVGATGNPVGWWLTLPANASSGTYTSTVMFELISAP